MYIPQPASDSARRLRRTCNSAPVTYIATGSILSWHLLIGLHSSWTLCCMPSQEVWDNLSLYLFAGLRSSCTLSCMPCQEAWGYELTAVAAAAWARSLAAVRRMRAASMPAPKPLSMLTTETPGDDAVSADSSGVRCSSPPPASAARLGRSVNMRCSEGAVLCVSSWSH